MSPRHRKRSSSIPRRQRLDHPQKQWDRGERAGEQAGEKMSGRDTVFGRFHEQQEGACRVSGESEEDGILVAGCSYSNL